MSDERGEMSARTESTWIKFTPETHARLSMVSTATGASIQDLIRSWVESGLAEKLHEYTIAARLLHGEQIAGNTRATED